MERGGGRRADSDQQADRRIFLTFIGWSLLIASLLALFQFLVSLNFLRFWTFHWFISIVFVVGLFAGGMSVLDLKSEEGPARLPSIFGAFYLFMGIILYLFMGYYQSAGLLGLAAFMGYTLLTGVAVSTGVASLWKASKDYLRFPSYGFGVASVLYIFLLMYKYVFYRSPFRLQIFIGEIVVAAAGSIIFVRLFKAGGK